MTYSLSDGVSAFVGLCLMVAVILFLIAVILSEKENP